MRLMEYSECIYPVNSSLRPCRGLLLHTSPRQQVVDPKAALSFGSDWTPSLESDSAEVYGAIVRLVESGMPIWVS